MLLVEVGTIKEEAAPAFAGFGMNARIQISTEFDCARFVADAVRIRSNVSSKCNFMDLSIF